MNYSAIVESPIGRLRLVSNGKAITALYTENTEAGKGVKQTKLSDGQCKVLDKAIAELTEYFGGKRVKFDVPLEPDGTEFQKKVWGVLCSIPYGTTSTYGQVAAMAGNPKAARAVGMANNRNPIMIMIPCHRVIGSGGALTGYAGGLDKKEFLLAHENKNL